MSETEPIPPTSSVTAQKNTQKILYQEGEYDLWSMKMRQYIAITDHILWDIITNGNQTTTDPASPSVSAPKTSLAANARRNNEKALNILLSAIPDRHLLSFHDAVDARSLWKAIKARFGGNEASKKMQKNQIYANLKFKKTSFCVACCGFTMIRGQPGLDELDFDDLYKQLKGVYEHELKGVLNSNSQNIAFLSNEGQGITLIKSNAEQHIPKRILLKLISQARSLPRGVDLLIPEITKQNEHMHFGQDGLMILTRATIAVDAPIILALIWLQTQWCNPEGRSQGTMLSLTVDALEGGRISGKGTIKTSCLDFEKVSYVEELKFNLLSVSQICDKKPPPNQLSSKEKNDVTALDLNCPMAKKTGAHVNFKNINKLVKGNLVRGLPSKTFKLDHSCVACRKGKQHRASCKKIEERTVREPLELSTRTYLDCVSREFKRSHERFKIVFMLNFLEGFSREIKREKVTDCKFIVHTTQPMASRGRMLQQEKEDKLSSDVERISIDKGEKEHVDSTFTLSMPNTPPQKLYSANTPTDSDDDTPTDGVLLFKLFCARGRRSS
ncbi:hypothetical protein Tco_1315725 [Tanacetum coccineum]